MNEKDALDEFLEILKIVILDVDKSFKDMTNYETNLKKKDIEISERHNHNEDKEWMIKLIKENDLQFRFRNFIRTVFSGIEGICAGLKEIILDSDSDKLKLKDKLKLQEIRINKKENGDVEEKPLNMSFQKNVKNVLKTFSIVLSNGNEIDFGGVEWNNFIKATGIRHRITHPKKGIDFYLTHKEVTLVKDSYQWFIKAVEKVQKNWHC
jgi:hypothetical protein